MSKMTSLVKSGKRRIIETKTEKPAKRERKGIESQPKLPENAGSGASKREFLGRPDPSSKREFLGRPDPSSKREFLGRPDPSSKREFLGRPDPSSKREFLGRPDPR